MPGTRLEALLVRPYELTEGALGPAGLELSLVGPTGPGAREWSELVLVANAFRDASLEQELPPVAWVSATDGGHSLKRTLRSGTARGWGAGGRRADVACCAAWRGALLDPGPPPCEATPRTLEDLLAAFRANLAATTGRSLDGWLDVLSRERLASAGDRLAWLRSEHGLGDATAAAIAGAEPER
jgi:hypothetical protein